jgi:molybdate transport system substrate-binding protein
MGRRRDPPTSLSEISPMATRRTLRARRWSRLALCAALLAIGCGRAAPTKPAQATTGPLRVAAASDLQFALPEIAEKFEVTYKTSVIPTLNASALLAEQIRGGAPFDVFLSADRKLVEELAAEKVLVPESVHPYAWGSLALVVNIDANVSVESLADLTKPEVKKIAIGNPAIAPYGAAAKQALERAGVWDRLSAERKIVQAEKVSQALQYVQTGNCEVGLVGRAISDVPELKIVTIDHALYDPIIQSLAIVANSPHDKAAQQFTRFVLDNEGQAILAKYGFRSAEEPAALKAANQK